MAVTNRAGSASAASQLSHADGRPGRAASQSASSMVFPAPAGPTTTARRTCSPRSSRSNSLDRCTSPGTSLGARNFEGGNRGLRGPGSAITVASDTRPRPPRTRTPQARPSVIGTEADPGRSHDFTVGLLKTRSLWPGKARLRPSGRTEVTRNRVTTQTPSAGTLAAASTTDYEAQSQCGHTHTRSLSLARQTEPCAHNSTTARSPRARTQLPSTSSCRTRLPFPGLCSGSPVLGSRSPTCTS